MSLKEQPIQTVSDLHSAGLLLIESGLKCGSAFIDTEFKRWLRDELGVANYAKLDPMNAHRRLTAHTLESGPIRRLVQDFIIRKQAFTQTSQDIRIDLPEPLSALNMENRVREGELTISRSDWTFDAFDAKLTYASQEMQALFEECTCGVIELMDSQIKKLSEAKNRPPRVSRILCRACSILTQPQNVFLVGGFGASQYLQYLLDEALDLRRKAILRRPDPDKS